MLTVFFAVFALGYRAGHREHLKSSENGFANFDELMRILEETTVSETWETFGALETMKPYRQNLSLAISDDIVVHDQDAGRGNGP